MGSDLVWYDVIWYDMIRSDMITWKITGSWPEGQTTSSRSSCQFQIALPTVAAGSETGGHEASLRLRARSCTYLTCTSATLCVHMQLRDGLYVFTYLHVHLRVSMHTSTHVQMQRYCSLPLVCFLFPRLLRAKRTRSKHAFRKTAKGCKSCSRI